MTFLHQLSDPLGPVATFVTFLIGLLTLHRFGLQYREGRRALGWLRLRLDPRESQLVLGEDRLAVHVSNLGAAPVAIWRIELELHDGTTVSVRRIEGIQKPIPARDGAWVTLLNCSGHFEHIRRITFFDRLNRPWFVNRRQWSRFYREHTVEGRLASKMQPRRDLWRSFLRRGPAMPTSRSG